MKNRRDVFLSTQCSRFPAKQDKRNHSYVCYFSVQCGWVSMKNSFKVRQMYLSSLILPKCLPAKKAVELGRLYICKYDVKYWKRLGNANHALLCYFEMCKKSQIGLTYNMGLIRINQIKETVRFSVSRSCFQNNFLCYTQGSLKIVFKVRGPTIQSVILNWSFNTSRVFPSILQEMLTH